MTEVDTLGAREVYQVLKDIALGVREVTHASRAESGQLHLIVDGWALTLHHEGGELNRCSACTAADGRRASWQNWPRYGTDPVQLLSRWEQEQLQKLLQAP